MNATIVTIADNYYLLLSLILNYYYDNVADYRDGNWGNVIMRARDLVINSISIFLDESR